jgi:hypothetical protein
MSGKKDKAADQKASKEVRAQFSKHLLEIQNAEFRVMHDICYVSGSIGIAKGGPPDPQKAAVKIVEYLVSRRIVKDVVFYNSWRTS